MKFFLLMILLATYVGHENVWAQAKIEEVEQYEIKTYDPQKSGLKDLVFEARIENLTEVLNKTKIFEKLIDVHFKIYWMTPNEYRIEVLGLPKGFQEVRDDLTTLIKGKLDFIIPERFSEKFKGYTLTAQPVTDGKLIKAIDSTYTLAIPEIDISFDKNGRLKTMETKSGASAVKTEFSQSPKSWSNNKLVLDKVSSVTKQGHATLTVTHSLEYVMVEGVGFPSKIAIKNVTEAIIPATKKDKEKKLKNEVASVIRFSNFQVNKGSAQSFMTEGLKK